MASAVSASEGTPSVLRAKPRPAELVTGRVDKPANGPKVWAGWTDPARGRAATIALDGLPAAAPGGPGEPGAAAAANPLATPGAAAGSELSIDDLLPIMASMIEVLSRLVEALGLLVPGPAGASSSPTGQAALPPLAPPAAPDVPPAAPDVPPAAPDVPPAAVPDPEAPGPAPTAAGPAAIGADAALAWQRDELAAGNSYSNYCLRFVRLAYERAGRKIPELQAPSAAESMAKFAAKGLLNPWDGAVPPKGAVILWDRWPKNQWGHIAISNGDGTVSTSGWPGFAGSPNIPLDKLEARLGRVPQGWALP